MSSKISTYAHSNWHVKDNSLTSINAPNVNITKEIVDVNSYTTSNLIEASLKKLNVPIGGDFHIHCDAPPGSGLGTSSAVNVALVGALWEGLGKSKEYPLEMNETKKKIAELAYDIERNDLGVKGGYQDQFAASFGGFNWIEYRINGTIHISPLRVSNRFKRELESRILLCYTGKTRDSGNIQEGLKKSMAAGSNTEHLHKIKEYAHNMKEALETEDVTAFAKWLHLSWMEKRNCAKGISNPFINELYETARNNGAIGGKVSGAGGGGFMYFIVEHPIQKIRIFEALEKVGVKHGAEVGQLPVVFEEQGVYSWRGK